MSYRDVVISQKPSFYIPLDDTAQSLNDISGNGAGSWGGTTKDGFLPRSLATNSTSTVSNTLNICRSDYQQNAFTIDFWCSPKYLGGRENNYITINSTNLVISSRRDEIVFTIRGADAVDRKVIKKVGVMDSLVHVTAIFMPGAISLLVNGEAATPTVLPQEFAWTGTPSTISIGSGVSHPAFFSRISTLDEIVARDKAGRSHQSLRDVCIADSGIFWDPAAEAQPPLFEVLLDSQDWGFGVSSNLVTDVYGHLTLKEQPNLAVYSGETEVAPTFTSNRLNLGVATRYAKRDASNALSNTGFVVANYVRGAVGGGDRWILTILNRDSGESWGWKVSSTGVAKLVHRALAAGDETITEYTYDTTVSSDTYFTIYSSNDEVLLYTGSINQVSGSNTVAIPIRVYGSTEIIYGADWDYSGDGIQQLDYTYLYNYAPDMAALSNDYTNLISSSLSTVYYLFSIGSTQHQATGTWDFQFAYPATGFYETHFVVWDGTEGYGSYATYEIDYAGLGYEALSWGGKIPDLPVDSEIGGAGEDQGPVELRITLKSVVDYRPFVRSIRFVVLQEDAYKAVNSDSTAGSTTNSVLIRGEPIPTFLNTSVAPRTISAQDVLAHSVEDPVKTVECVVALTSTSSGEVVCLDNNTIPDTYNISYNGTTITNNGFDSVYVNGVLMAAPLAVSVGKRYHIIAITSDAVDSDIFIGNHYTNPASGTRIGILAVAGYDYEFDADQVAEHYQAFKGEIVGSHTQVDSMTYTESIKPQLYAYAWETAGDTT